MSQVTVTMSGRLNVHGWLPFSSTRSRPFTFQFDPNAHFDRSRWQSVAGPFSQDLGVSPHLFVLSPNNKLLVTCGHWDNSFRVFSIERGRQLARNDHHNDIVTCMALDRVGTGEHLITGSRDTTCVVWRFASNEVYEHPLQILYGHDSEVMCVDISTELDMAVSGAKDGTCIIHTVGRGHYMHTLLPRKERHRCVVNHAHISSLGRVLIYTEDKQARSKVSWCAILYQTPSKCVCVSTVDLWQEEVISYQMSLLSYSRKFFTWPS
jgi:WD40 repeat protein